MTSRTSAMSRKHRSAERRLSFEALEARELLSGLGVNDPFMSTLATAPDDTISYLPGGAISGDILPENIGVIQAPNQQTPATINPYYPPQEVKAWIDGSTIHYRAEVNGQWQEGVTTYSSKQVIVDVLAQDGIVAWTVGKLEANGRIVARRVGFAVFDTNGGGKWVQSETPSFGVLAVSQLVNRDGLVAWTVGYPTGNGDYIPREVGAAIYDSSPGQGWKTFQTQTSGGSKTIEALYVNDGALSWSIGQPGDDAGQATPIKGVAGAVYDFQLHDWKRYQVNAKANETFVGFQDGGGGAFFWQKVYGDNPSGAVAQDIGAATYDEMRHVWKSNQTTYNGRYQVSDLQIGDKTMAWKLIDPASPGRVAGIGLGAFDTSAGGIVTKTITIASGQTLDSFKVQDGIVAWINKDVSNADRQQLNLAVYDSGQRTWKLWCTPASATQRIANLQIDGWVGWTVQKKDSSGNWVDKSAALAVYDAGRGMWNNFQSPEATDRCVMDFALGQGIAAWKIGSQDSPGSSYVARNVGTACYNYISGVFHHEATTNTGSNRVDSLVVGDGVAAWTIGNEVFCRAWDPMWELMRPSDTWTNLEDSWSYSGDVRIGDLKTEGGLVAWTIKYRTDYDDSYTARQVGYAVYDRFKHKWQPEKQDDTLYDAVSDLRVEDQFVYFTADGRGYRKAYDQANAAWTDGDPTVKSAFVVAPMAILAKPSVTVIDRSMGATECVVDFGDGWKSKGWLNVHAYSKPGLYTVTQTVYGPGGRDTSVAQVVVVPDTDAIDLDTISSVTLTDQSPRNGFLWYRFEVEADGAFTANMSGQDLGAETTMVLCTETNGAYSILATGTTSLHATSVSASTDDVQTTYYLIVRGLKTDDKVNITLDNPSMLSLDGQTVTILGRDSADTAEMGFYGDQTGSNPKPVAIINEVTLFFDSATTQVIFDAAGGQDQVSLLGASGNETAWMGLRNGRPEGQLTANGFTLSTINAENITVVGNGGNDVAEINDTPGQDLFIGKPGESVMEGNGLRFVAQDVATVHGYSRLGGGDRAELHDSAGNDVLVATPAWSRIISEDGSYFVRAKGFADVTVIADAGGRDTAELRDSAGHDSLTINPTAAELTGPNFRISTKGFKQVIGRSSSGGQDEVYIKGSTGADTLQAEPGRAELQTADGFQASVYGFSQIEVMSMGGKDQATLLDSPGDDVLTANFRDVVLTSGSNSVRVRGYGDVTVEASRGGQDVAHLYDTAGDDLFVGNPTEGTMTSLGFAIRVKMFDYVHAYSLAGGHDVAQLTGSTGDDELVGRPEWVRLSGSGYLLRAKGFEEVHVDPLTGNDTAVLYDSPGADRLVANATDLTLSADSSSISYLNHLMNFDRVEAKSQGGANTKSIDPEALAYLVLSGRW